MFLINLASLYLAQIHYFLEVGARVLLEVATKIFIRGKKLWKFRFLSCFSKCKREECDQKVWDVFDQFDITIPCSDTYFLEVDARVSLKVVTKGSIRGKKTLKIQIFRLFSNVKTEDCDQKFWNIFDQFAITIPCSDTCFLEVGARLSLKVATKGSIRGKKNSENLEMKITFLKQKRRSPTKKIDVSLIHLELLALLSYISSENGCACFTQTSHESFFWWQKNSENLHFYATFPKQNGAVRPKKIKLI